MESQPIGLNTINSVKNLVLQFEKKKIMGVDQSYSDNPPTNLTKQYVSQSSIFDRNSVGRKHLNLSVSEDYMNKKCDKASDFNYMMQTCDIINDSLYITNSDSNSNQNEFQQIVYLKDVAKNSFEDVSDFKLDADVENLDKKEIKPKVKSVKSLRKIFEQNTKTNSKRYQTPHHTINTKSRSESNLSTSCATKKTWDFDALHRNRYNSTTDNKKSNENLCIDKNEQRQSFVDNEFQQIEDSLKEVEAHIREMQDQIAIDKNCYSNTRNSIECINIYLTHQDSDYNNSSDEDDDYGQQALGNHDSVEFVEAFNRLGDELVITTASIERKSVCIDDVSENRISIRLSAEFSSEQSLSSDHNSVSSEDESPTTSENSTSSYEILIEENGNDCLITSNLDTLPNSDKDSASSTAKTSNHLYEPSNKSVKTKTREQSSSSNKSIISEKDSQIPSANSGTFYEDHSEDNVTTKSLIISNLNTRRSNDNKYGDNSAVKNSDVTNSAVKTINYLPNVIKAETAERSLSSEGEPLGSGDESNTFDQDHNDGSCIKFFSTSKTRSSSDEECGTSRAVQTRNHLFGIPEKAVRAETIYDSFQNPIIEKVTNINRSQATQHAEPERSTSPIANASSNSDLKEKKDYVIEELISTEKDYLKHLEMVVCSYMPAFRSDKLPTFLKGSKYIFGNIKKIYNKSHKFYRALKKCGTDHEKVARTFIIFEELFELYPLYSKNKPTADYFLMGELRELVLVKEKMLRDRLGLASHLLTPVQRLGKYILLLEKIQNEIVKSGNFASENVRKAIEIVRKQMSRGNDFIAIDSIKDCPINLAEHAGSFLMRENFYIHKPKKYEAMLFFFEKVLVFTTVDVKNLELFIYKDSIPLNEMGVITFEDSPLSFHLRRFSSSKKSSKDFQEFIIEARKTKDKKTWTEEIEKRLWEQLIKCKEQQKALQSKQKTRHSTVEISNRITTKKASCSSLPGELRNSKRRSVFYDEAED